jgi:hypothetical protein
VAQQSTECRSSIWRSDTSIDAETSECPDEEAPKLARCGCGCSNRAAVRCHTAFALLVLPTASWACLSGVPVQLFWTHSDKNIETLTFFENSAFNLAFIVLAIVFDPLWPVHMPRATWFWLDVSAATVLGVFLFGQVIGRRKATKPR